ncbi:hypothetical protein N7539_002436 [Penicillium diatomitis]|uniref:Uncharacterized protein n=1 Tax=Penicillium diatomitis TaxID=2819901 RepID=A0A9W9XEN1_9EURO|nr:uncharacterized protein N7539_002436 [Penicillium diatomitis]KAJ5490869.1 hypothetical protein N7539_002436 [Penicillium diatomitis]
MNHPGKETEKVAMVLFERFSFSSLEAHKTGCSDFNQPVWWIDIQDATEQDIRAVSHAFSIHPLTAEDVVIREPREKVDVWDDYYLICFQTLIHQSLQKQEQPEIQVSVALCILVFQCRAITSLSGIHVNRVRERIHGMHNPSILTSDWICYAMIDEIINSFESFARDAEREGEAIEDQIYTVRIDDAQILLPRVNVLRKKIAQITRYLSRKVDVLNGYVKCCQAPTSTQFSQMGSLFFI